MNHLPYNGVERRADFALLNKVRALAAWTVAALLFAGCASSPDTHRQTVATEKPARPGHILVHDFAATPSDIQGDAPVGARISAGTSLPAEQVAMDRLVASNMTARLVAAIREMGLPAERALSTTPSQVGDVVIRGYLVSIFAGEGAKRLNIGLDPAASELTTMVESFQVMPQGYGRALGSGPATAEEKALRAVVGATDNPTGNIVTSGLKAGGEAGNRSKIDDWAGQAVTEIAARLKTRFQQQGWIN